MSSFFNPNINLSNSNFHPNNSKKWYGSTILEECKRLRKSILPISEANHGPLETTSIYGYNTLYPFVLLLGNHSSGKSSFINYLLGRKIQSTGVAPTDDNFTIIAPSNNDEEGDFDRNGPAFINDPDLGFHELKVFGPVLINHTQLKVRSNINIKDFMIVDSPGMIDSPALFNNNLYNNNNNNNNSNGNGGVFTNPISDQERPDLFFISL